MSTTPATKPPKPSIRARVRTAGLARELGVSDRTVRNYVARGMPFDKEDEYGRWFDIAACRQWLEANPASAKGGPGRGGRRAGAGRKSAESKDQTSGPEASSMQQAYDDAHTVAVVKQRIEDGVSPADGIPTDGVLAMTPHELSVLCRLYPPGHKGFNAAQLATFNAGLESQKRALAIAKEAGRLVDVEEAAKAFGAALTELRRTLDDLPGRLAAGVQQQLTEAGVLTTSPMAAQALIRDAIEGEVGRTLAMLAKAEEKSA